MKKLRFFLPPALFILLAAISATGATVFTNNAVISAFNTNYDGEDIVISNCAVTVDGVHSFGSLLIASGGVLTHSFFPNGTSSTFLNVTDEPLVLSSTNPAALLNTNASPLVVVTDTGHTTTYTNGVDYVVASQPDGTTQIQWTNTSAISDGATVLISYSWLCVVPAGLNLTVNSSVTVDGGGSINARGNGYGPALGSGRGFTSSGGFTDGSGAGYGGGGGNSSSNAIGGVCYGSVSLPGNLGSGGGASYAGAGGAGGGLIQIAAGGNMIIDGSILANGVDATNSRAGGGSGGSIRLSAESIAGTGNITANGGAGEPVHGGGGGGGRISIQCSANNFAGTMTACGGNGWIVGGAGTIFTKVTGQNGLLLVDNGGRPGTNSTVSLPSQMDVLIRSGARVVPAGSWSTYNLTVASNGTIAASPQVLMTLNVNGTLAIQPGGLITADSLGYTAGNGTGAGHFYYDGANSPCSGGGHGGTGALGSPTNAAAGAAYGSQTAPVTFGSGGGNYLPVSTGGSGGGALQISVIGTVQVDGIILANGSNGSGTGGGGGAGGSIFITATTLNGGGVISASGGNGAGNVGGGGGGGRIAIVTGGLNTFAGALNAAGGGGANWGGAGTIYLQQSNPTSYQLILDNAGHAGTNTPLQTLTGTSLIVRNGAVGTGGAAVSSMTFAGLTISSNAWLMAFGPSSYGGLSVTINGNATIQSGGGITANRAGYNAGTGYSPAGAYQGFPYPCGGGGHGGAGGNAMGNLAFGGSANEYNVPLPSYAGGGGGNLSPYSVGGAGGGVVQLTVSGTLHLDGTISANGDNGNGSGGGGGAGGSVNLSAGTIDGGGAILANGGNGVGSISGGGGGGCIAIALTTNLFTGSLAAYGGGGANYGGAGTIYLATNKAAGGASASLIVDNAGHVGANTLTYSSPTTDLTLRNGGLIYVSGSTACKNLLISSNAMIVVSNGTQVATLNLTAAGNVTVQPGGGISADAIGYRASQGNGAGGYYGTSPYYPGGGGGHGGYGASSFTNYSSNGGTAGYDNMSAPTTAGGGGGGSLPYSIGGNGGGIIQMTVTGKLQIDGTLSANGGNGSGTGGGGGSGGALNLNVGGLAGGGTISANGGNGVAAIGGGGGGGVIACSFQSNLFSGTISAYGGGGAGYGGAGTVYLKTNNANQAMVVVDNSSHLGTNTPLLSAGVNNNNVILRNGAIGFQAYPSQTYYSLLIASNAWLVANSAPGNNYPGIVNLTVIGNATLQPGGGILTDATGSTPNNGTGHGSSSGLSPWYPCSGAGHGGYGANALSNAFGGIAFDSTTSPSVVGSGGGGYATFSVGGTGGGYVRLVVNGTLQLDGSISANGGNGSGSGGGGGSGGSIYLAPYTFAGSGSVTANGGKGANVYGGGGGGGRIAILNISKTNSFTGIISAYGGGGANYGGAGTIYYGPYYTNFAQVILDNNNNAGTNTTFDFLSGMDVTIQNQATGVMPVSGSWSPRNILIRTNGALIATSLSGQRSINANFITIATGGILSVDGAGSGPQSGVGSGSPGPALRGGGGHGGYGGGNIFSGGGAYGSIQSPNSPGSGGANYNSGPPYSYGGSGGGALQLTANTLTVNGRLSANGLNGGPNSGGGSGGSLYLASIVNLSGTGIISADGGSATGTAGGGGGGRIAILCTSNSFTGQLSAHGGAGLYPGGAGTIYSRKNSNYPLPELLVDNGGIHGTNTPLSSGFALPATLFNLTLSGNAIVVPLTPLPLLSNLTINAGSTLTLSGAPAGLNVAVLKDFNLAGNVTLDNVGYPQANGPGAGNTNANQGSGGGYGGAGGNSASGALGGVIYGSAVQPMDFGSGGGSGVATTSGGSEGGGAVQLKVGGTLTINGSISANGDFGWQDNSGGGAGGSIWITASTLAGAGNLSAAGGDGDLYNGGGGGGGRIAIYAPTNLFAGTTNVNGGAGASTGQPGTVYLSSILGGLQISSQSPTGTISTAVSYVDLTYNEVINPTSVSAANFSVTTPAGPLDPSTITTTVVNLSTVRVSFPSQNLMGDYAVQAGTGIADIFGVTPGQTYAGSFTIVWPTLSGSVSDTNGAPIANVLLQPDGGLAATMTDTNGNYSLDVPPGWNGTVTPSSGSFVFVPGAQTYANVTGSLTNQNYLMVTTIAPSLAGGLSGTNLLLNWTGLAGVTYRIEWSTNLVDWQPLGNAVPGTNGPMQIDLPMDTDPVAFFRLGATN